MCAPKGVAPLLLGPPLSGARARALAGIRVGSRNPAGSTGHAGSVRREMEGAGAALPKAAGQAFLEEGHLTQSGAQRRTQTVGSEWADTTWETWAEAAASGTRPASVGHVVLILRAVGSDRQLVAVAAT